MRKRYEKLYVFIGDIDGILGNGFERILYGEAGPKKESLDSIDSKRPIGIISGDIHAMWVNSRALEIAGITKDTPNPPGGVIVKDPKTGEPTGMLQEMPAMSLVWDILPPPTKEDYKAAFLWGQKLLNSKGITTIHDAWMEFDPNFYKAYDELAKAGKLTVRVRGSWYIEPNNDYMAEIEEGLELSERFTHPHFKVNSFKYTSDGVVEEETALLLKPYSHRSDFNGIKNWTDKQMLEASTKINDAGYQLHVHCIGDSAAKYTLDVLEQLQGINGKRHSLAHLQLVRPEDVIRIGALGVTAHMSPYWMVMDEGYDNFYLPYLGAERAGNTYPHKNLLEINTEEIPGVEIKMTFFEGKRVY